MSNNNKTNLILDRNELSFIQKTVLVFQIEKSVFGVDDSTDTSVFDTHLLVLHRVNDENESRYVSIIRFYKNTCVRRSTAC